MQTLIISITPTRNIALTSELEAFIKAEVATGLYGNASEVVRAALRLMIERHQSMHQALPARLAKKGRRV